jgi:HAD superfamily hydrolase (TIGR01509 family)
MTPAARKEVGVAWDIDGTLIDSEPLHEAALRAVCAQYGADLSDFDHDRFVGVHILDVWALLARRLKDRVDRATWIAAIENYYAAHKADLVPTPGAIEVITRLAAMGVPQACVSNSSRRTVDTNLAALGIADKIAFSLSLDDVPYGKPDPAPYRLACAGLRLACANVFAVEDSPTGIASARAAGLRVLGYAGTGGQVERADHVIDALPRVFDFVAFAPAT